MSIKNAIKTVLSFDDESLPKLVEEAQAYEISLEENIDLQTALSNVVFALSQVKVADPQPDDLPDGNEPDPLADEVKSIATKYREATVDELRKDHNKPECVRIAKLFGIKSSGTETAIAALIVDAIEAYWEDNS